MKLNILDISRVSVLKRKPREKAHASLIIDDAIRKYDEDKRVLFEKYWL